MEISDGAFFLSVVRTVSGWVGSHPLIEGQVYGVRPIAEETLAYGSGDSYNPWDFVSLLVFDVFKSDDPPTWYGSLQPIFQQYANLYPVMKAFVDLADYDSVCANRQLLLLAFRLPPEDPNSMPVTRDLSAGKRAAILRWLSEPGEDGKLRRGKAPLGKAAEALPTIAAEPPSGPLRGGKSVAMSRRLFAKKRSR